MRPVGIAATDNLDGRSLYLQSFNEAAASLPRITTKPSQPTRGTSGFNEAAALFPRITWGPACDHAQRPGFNEAAALLPRMTRTGGDHQCSRCASFNEAAACKPRKTLPDAVYGLAVRLASMRPRRMPRKMSRRFVVSIAVIALQ